MKIVKSEQKPKTIGDQLEAINESFDEIIKLALDMQNGSK